MISAIGGLGGFFPPLLLTAIYSITGQYSIGFMALAQLDVLYQKRHPTDLSSTRLGDCNSGSGRLAYAIPYGYWTNRHGARKLFMISFLLLLAQDKITHTINPNTRLIVCSGN